jgi:hypothetical protein
MSGPREGIAYLTFSSDFTFTGYEVVVPKAAKKNSSSSDSRDNTGGRGDSGSSSTNTPGQQIFGSMPISGRWGYDIQGKIIGSFVEVSELENCVTNSTAVATNTDGIFGLPGEYPVGPDANGNTIWYVNEINCSALTNGISFVGKVATAKRLTLLCSTPFGKVNYRGVPAVTLTNLSGAYYGNRQQNNQSFLEFFNLATSGSLPNTYDINNGEGPGYTYSSGLAILSSQKKFAFTTGIDPDGVVVRAVIGSFNLKKMSTSTRGWQQPSGTFSNPVRFDATQQPPTGP